MRNKLLTAISAALVSVPLLAGAPALAQAQLSDSVQAQVVGLGFDPAEWTLTPEQLLQIENVLGSTDDEQSKVDQINNIVAEE